MTLGRKGNSIIDFMNKVHKDDNDCWIWKGYIDKDGYGTFSYRSKEMRAHRWSYMHFVGSLDNNLTIDHICNVRACVNPKHLQQIPIKDNILRGSGPSARNAKKTHCRHGHAFADNNVVHDKKQRRCRECSRLSARKHYWKKKHENN